MAQSILPSMQKRPAKSSLQSRVWVLTVSLVLIEQVKHKHSA